MHFSNILLHNSVFNTSLNIEELLSNRSVEDLCGWELLNGRMRTREKKNQLLSLNHNNARV